MTSFEDRAEAYTAKFAHEEELEFKIIARRNKLFGLWAANRLELSEDAIENYALELVHAYVHTPSDSAIISKTLNDFQSKGIEIGKENLEDQLELFRELAAEQVGNR